MANRYPLQQQQSQMQPMRNNVPAAYPRPRAGMWPYQEEQNEKQREYLKQQQKLRLMAATSAPQTVSADALIENLLGKKETFKPKTTHHTVQPASQQMVANVAPGMVPPHMGGSMRSVMGYPGPSSSSSSPSMVGGYGNPAVPPDIPSTTSQMASQAQFAMNLPAWLTPTSPLFPQFYRQVWRMVGQEKGLVDTTRIFPLLLTSGLPTEILGFIWGLANRKVAGQLTEQELYIVLALVALAQSGCTFNNLSILNLIPQPPVPNLKLVGFESLTSTPVGDSESIAAAATSQGKMKREDLNLGQLSTQGDDAGFDEFTDFQSATAVTPETAVVPNAMLMSNSKDPASFSKSEVEINISTVTPSVIPQLSPPMSSLEVSENPAAKCPSVMVVSSGHGRGIGSRLANHSLGAPKQKKSKHHHHHHHHRSQVQVLPNIPISVDEDFSEFQQAKEVNEDNTEAFPKCTLKAMPQGKTYLLKESAIRSEVPAQPTPEAVNIPPAEERTLPSSEKISSKDVVAPKAEGVNLMAVEEDKYSALRNLVLADQDTSPEKPQVFSSIELSPASDEFGDFLSAEPAQLTDDSFADIASREQLSSAIVDLSGADIWKNVEAPQAAEFQVDDWGDFQDAVLTEGSVTTTTNQASDIVGENHLSGGIDSAKIEAGISAAFMTLDLSSGASWNQQTPNVLEKDKLEFFPSLSEPSADLNLGSGWDLKLKDDSSGQSDGNLNATENSVQSSPFQGFLGKIYDDKQDNIFGSTSNNQMHEQSDNFDADIQIVGADREGGEDDFGDFVGPDTWTEDQKYNVGSKDLLFEGHLGVGLKDGLYGDSQSVSSLELPPLALSRHGSVPSLDLKIFPSTAEKNGGNGGNQPWDMSPQGIDHQLNEWQRCLQSCLTLLQSAVETFSNISSEEVLDEVVGSAEGKDYLQNLLEVAGVSHRVECSYKQLTDYKKLDSLLADIDSAWTSLEQYYQKADIAIDLELAPSSGSTENSNCVSEPTTCCGVCLTDVDCGAKTNHNRNTSQLEYGGHVYHSVCANLWVNCVDSSLPALAVSSGSFL